MWSMHELGHAGVHGGHHRLWAHRVYLDPDADFLRFINDGLEVLDLLGGWSRLGRQVLLADKLDAELGKPLDFGTSFFGSLVAAQIDATGWDDAWSFNDAFINMVLER